MHHTPATPASQPGNLSTYRLEHLETGLPIKLFCPIQQVGEPLRIIPRLSTPKEATRFAARDAAVLIASTHFPEVAVEAVRVDA